jgi:hypothetical protein
VVALHGQVEPMALGRKIAGGGIIIGLAAIALVACIAVVGGAWMGQAVVSTVLRQVSDQAGSWATASTPPWPRSRPA